MKIVTQARAAAEYLRQAAQLNVEDPNRRGSLLEFGGAGQLVMTGDLHGHQRNFEKLQRFCDLRRHPARFVILHEMIHGELTPPDFLDASIDLLVLGAAWKCEFPDNVFFLQSNHEMSQWLGHEITKGGHSVLHEFGRGVLHRFGPEGADVLAAAGDFIASLPLAARTARGVLLSHSLPGPAATPNFDLSVLERTPTRADCEPGGAAYELVWGRFQRPADLDVLAERLGVETFIVGHMPQDEGYAVVGRMLILASDHAHGMFVPLDLAKAHTAESLAKAARKFVSVE